MVALFDDKSFYFDADVFDPLVVKKFDLRSELEYDEDKNAEKTALKCIEKISRCFDGNVYLVTASQDISPENKLRSKKGVLWNAKHLRNLDARNSEVEIDDGCTRIVSLVDLGGYNYDESEEVVLNWLYSFIVLSEVDIDILNGFVSRWVCRERASMLVFNYDVVAKDLANLSETVVLRYFPADNGRNETLVVVGDKEYLRNSVEGCIGSAI